MTETQLLELADGYHPRRTWSLGSQRISDHTVKLYAIAAPEREDRPAVIDAAQALAADQLRIDRSAGSLGLAVVLAHAGADGDFVLVHTWIEGYMSRLAVFTGPADRPEALRPAPVGLGPCVWEAAVLAHEREAYLRCILTGEGPVPDRIAAWTKDVFST